MDKKNTLLLTVIAIATLLVAVVGATFAYFTAQAGEAKSATVDVKTETVDTLTYKANSVYLVANQQNFANVNGEDVDTHAGSQRAVSTSTVEYTKGGEGSKDYCYEVKFNITKNDFVYAPGDTNFGTDTDGTNRESSFKNQNAPELLLKITKKSEKKSKDGEFSANGEDIAYGSKSNQPLVGTISGEELITCSPKDETAKKGCVYYEHLTNQRKVCTQTNVEPVTGSITYDEEACKENQTLEGFDVTVLNNAKASKIPNYSITEIKIPTADGGSTYKHTLNGTSEGDIVRDTWTAELVFVNYNWDQQYNATSNNAETPKNFNATFNFKTVDCGE